jgi:hypothetical protein
MIFEDEKIDKNEQVFKKRMKRTGIYKLLTNQERMQ